MKEEDVIPEARIVNAEVDKCLDRIEKIPAYFPREVRRELARVLIGQVVLCSINVTMKLVQDGMVQKFTDIMKDEQTAKKN